MLCSQSTSVASHAINMTQYSTGNHVRVCNVSDLHIILAACSISLVAAVLSGATFLTALLYLPFLFSHEQVITLL